MGRLARPALLLASLATAGMAVWLFWVVVTVLPVRDPAHLAFWRTAGIGFLAFAVLSWVFLVNSAVWLRWVVALLSLAALGAGLYAIVVTVAAPEGRFEGYLLLMGLVLSLHGLAGLASTLRVRPAVSSARVA